MDTNRNETLESLASRAKTVNGDQAIRELIAAIGEKLDEPELKIPLLRLRAELYAKLQEYGKAINDYNRILEHDPNDGEAGARVEMLKTILRFNNTDIYASPNTNFDPWME